MIHMNNKRSLSCFFEKLYLKIFPNQFLKILEKEFNDCKSVLDIGCGYNTFFRDVFKNVYSVGIDIHDPAIQRGKKEGIHNECYRMNALDIGKRFKADSFDCAIAVDLIEHFEKKDGLKLIKMMERVARKKIIILTPNGFVFQKQYGKNKWQRHKSGWNAKEMRNIGFRVNGIGGLKFLRGEMAVPVFRPKFLWIVVADMSNIFVYNKPEKAFHICCIKEI